MIKTLHELEVFNLSTQLAMEIFRCASKFPKEEKYSLTSQIISASRSISANIAEGWGRRHYENEIKKHLVYAMGSLEETKAWLLFAKECLYIPQIAFEDLESRFDSLGVKIYKLYENWKTF